LAENIFEPDHDTISDGLGENSSLVDIEDETDEECKEYAKPDPDVISDRFGYDSRLVNVVGRLLSKQEESLIALDDKPDDKDVELCVLA